MKIEIQYFKRVVMVSVGGGIGYVNAEKLDDELRGLREEGHKNFVIELSGIDFMSSAALGALLTTYKECKKKGGDLRIASPSKRAKEDLKLGGVDPLVVIYDDTISAVGSF